MGMSETVFYECKSKLCERSKKPCILAMPDSWYDGQIQSDKKRVPSNCPFIEELDGDNAEWEQISRVTITRKY